MKRLFFVLLLIISSVICFGQDLKDDAEWTRLIDLVCSRYVQSFCDQRCKEDLPQQSIDKYNTNIRPKLDGIIIGEALNRQELQELLTKNGFSKANRDVVKKLHTKYDIEASSRSIESALDLSILDKNISDYLIETKNALNKELQERYLPTPPNKVAPATQVNSKDSQHQGSTSFVWKLLSLLELLLLVGLIAFVFFRTGDERIKRIVFNSGRLEEKFARKNELVDLVSIQEVKMIFNSLETEIKKLKESSTKHQTKHQQNIEYRQQMPAEVAMPPQPTFAPVFVKNFGKGLLRVVDISEAQFRLDLVNESNAKFSFCGDVSKALANSDGTFDYVCEQEGAVVDAKDIRTSTPGSATKQADGKWLVTVKAKIIFV